MTDRDTIVVKDGGSSTGVLLGIIAIIIALGGEDGHVRPHPRGPGRRFDQPAQRHQRERPAAQRGAESLLGASADVSDEVRHHGY